MHRTLMLLAALALASSCKKKEEAPAKAADPVPAKPEAPPMDQPAKPAPPPTPTAAPIDPATFVPIDVSGVAALAKVTIKGPPGANVTADEPHFGKDKPEGVTITSGDWSLHLYRGTLGGERTGLPIMAQSVNGKYAETVSNEKLVEYTITTPDKTTYGFVRPVITPLDGTDQVLCGPARELASADGFAAYRAACDTVAAVK